MLGYCEFVQCRIIIIDDDYTALNEFTISTAEVPRTNAGIL